MDKIKKDLLSGILIIAIGVVFLVLTQQTLADLPPLSFDFVQDAGFPRVLSILLIMLGVMLTCSSLFKFVQTREMAGEKKTFDVSQLKNTLILWTIMAAFAWGLQLVGYLIAAPLFILAYFPYTDKKNFLRHLAVAILLPTFVYVGFRYGLDVVFPYATLFR